MADLIIKLNSDEGDLLQTLDGITNKLSTIDSELSELNSEQKKTFNEFEKSVKSTEEVLKDTNEEIGKSVVETSKLEKETNKTNKSLSDFIKNETTLGGQISNTVTKLKGKVTALKGMTAGLGTGTSALGKFKIALASTGIGLIVIALGSLVTFLTSTQRGMDAVTKVTRPLSVVFQRLIGVTQNLGGAIFDFLISPLESASAAVERIQNLFSDGLIQGFKNVGSEIKNVAQDTATFFEESVQQGLKLDAAIKSIEESENSLIVRRSELNRITKEQNQIAEDTTKTLKEREAAAIAAGNAQSELLKLETDLADQKIDRLKLEQTFNDSSREDLKELAELEAARNEAATAAAEQQTTLQNKLNTIRREAETKRIARLKEINAEIQKQTDLLNDQLAELEDRVNEIEFSNFTPEQKLAETRKLALEEIENLKQGILDAAESLNKDIDIDAQINELVEDVNKAYAEGLVKIAEEQNSIDLPTTEFQITEPEIDVDGIVQPVESSLDSAERSIGEKLEKFRDSVIDGLGLDDESLELIGDGVSQIVDATSEIFDAQIERQDALISKIDERINKQQEAVDAEAELAEQGLANNLDVEQRRLDELESQRAAAEKKKNDALIKQQKLELGVNAARVASEIAVTVAKAANANAGFGLAGIATLAAQLTAVFALMAKFRALSKQQSQSFYEGGLLPTSIGDDRIGNGAFINGTNIKVGGEEFIVNKQSTKKNKKFIARINNHEFDNVDLEEMVQNNIINQGNQIANMRGNTTVIKEKMTELDYSKLETIYSRQVDRLINSNESRPVIAPADSSYTEITKKGKNIYKKTIRK